MTSKDVFEALHSGNTGAVLDVLQQEPNLFRSKGWATWLASAADTGNIVLLEAFVKAGADVNAKTAQNSSPEGAIDIAAGEGHLEAVKWFLDQGAIVNHVVEGQPRCFALTGAAFRGRLDVVRLLVERGAWINCNWANMTPLDHAMMYGQTEVVEYLRSVGAKTSAELAESSGTP